VTRDSDAGCQDPPCPGVCAGGPDNVGIVVEGVGTVVVVEGVGTVVVVVVGGRVVGGVDGGDGGNDAPGVVMTE